MKTYGQDSSTTALVIEDQFDCALLLETILGDLGYQVTIAPDASTAVNSIAGGLRPNLILSDLSIPGAGRDGEIVNMLRESLNDPQPPIILVSGNAELSEISEKLQVAAFIKKPYAIAEIFETIKRFSLPQPTTLPQLNT